MEELFEQYNTIISIGLVVVIFAVGYIRVGLRAKKMKQGENRRKDERHEHF